TWNLGFVSHYGVFPFFFAKLLAPQVLCYHADPKAYIYNRGLALYTHIQFVLFSLAGRGATIDWSEKELTKLWGKANAASAADYDAALAKAAPSIANKLKKRLGDAYSWLRANSAGKLLGDLQSFLQKDVLAKMNPKTWDLKG